MNPRARVFLVLLALAVIGLAAQAAPRWLRQIQANAGSRGPYRDVTVTQAEANAYWSGEGARLLPKGLSQVAMSAAPGELSGRARVDFDQIEAQHGGNPLLWMFRGAHLIAVRARVDSAVAPAARLTVTEVRVDGQVIPNLLVDAALAAFVQPKHPEIGRQFAVALPEHVTSVTVGAGTVTLHYPH